MVELNSVSSFWTFIFKTTHHYPKGEVLAQMHSWGLVSNLFFYKTPNLCILSNNAVPLSFRKLHEELLLITSVCQWVLSCIVFWLAQNVPVGTFENIGFISLLISQLLDWKVAKIIFRRNLSHLNKQFSFFKVPCHPPPPWMRNFLMRCCCMAPPPFKKPPILSVRQSNFWNYFLTNRWQWSMAKQASR